MNYVRPLNLSPCTTGGLSIPLQDAEGNSLVMALISANRISAALTLTRTSPTYQLFFCQTFVSAKQLSHERLRSFLI
jgi:hypothetical protein